MKNVKQFSVLILISIFVFATSTVNAQKHNCNGAKGHVHGVKGEIPNLTEKQDADIKTLRTSYQKETQTIKDQMGIKRAELKALQNVENPDLDAINKKIEEKASLRTDLEKKTVAHRQAVRLLLNDEQKVAFDKRGKSNCSTSHKCGTKAGKKCGGEAKAPCKK